MSTRIGICDFFTLPAQSKLELEIEGAADKIRFTYHYATQDSFNVICSVHGVQEGQTEEKQMLEVDAALMFGGCYVNFEVHGDNSRPWSLLAKIYLLEKGAGKADVRLLSSDTEDEL